MQQVILKQTEVQQIEDILRRGKLVQIQMRYGKVVIWELKSTKVAETE